MICTWNKSKWSRSERVICKGSAKRTIWICHIALKTRASWSIKVTSSLPKTSTTIIKESSYTILSLVRSQTFIKVTPAIVSLRNKRWVILMFALINTMSRYKTNLTYNVRSIITSLTIVELSRTIAIKSTITISTSKILLKSQLFFPEYEHFWATFVVMLCIISLVNFPFFCSIIFSRFNSKSIIHLKVYFHL